MKIIHSTEKALRLKDDLGHTTWAPKVAVDYNKDGEIIGFKSWFTPDYHDKTKSLPIQDLVLKVAREWSTHLDRDWRTKMFEIIFREHLKANKCSSRCMIQVLGKFVADQPHLLPVLNELHIYHQDKEPYLLICSDETKPAWICHVCGILGRQPTHLDVCATCKHGNPECPSEIDISDCTITKTPCTYR